MRQTPETKLAAIRLYEEGMPLRELERTTNVDRKELREWIRRYREEGPEGLGRKPYSHPSYEVRCEAARLFLEEGVTYVELGRRFGMSRSQLKKWVSIVRASGYGALVEKTRGRPRKHQNHA